MLIQHLLTIRLFDTIFDNPDLVRRNGIAAEVEKVIDALASIAFCREQFLKSLDRFFVASNQPLASKAQSAGMRQAFRGGAQSITIQDYELMSTES